MKFSGPFRIYAGLVLFSILGSGFVKVSGFSPGVIAPGSAAITLLAGTWAAIRTCRPFKWPREAALFGALSELVGLATGYPFGRYEYTRAWWPVVFLGPLGHFPLLLPVAWLMIVGAAERITRPLATVPGVLASGGIAAAVDFVMEPVAVGPLGYWRWLHPEGLPGGASWLNPVGWFAVSCVGAAFLRRSEAPDDGARREAGFVLALHLMMLGAIYGLGRL